MAVLYVADLGCAVLALRLAEILRVRLSLGDPAPATAAQVPGAVLLMAVAAFAVILPMAGVYDPRRILRAVDEAERAVLGVLVAAMVLSGALYLSYREVSRLVFAYFVAMALVLLLGYRVVVRLLYRVLPVGEHRPVQVLIAGTGPRAREAARILEASGVTVVGFVDGGPTRRGLTLEGRPVLGGLDDLPGLVERCGVTDVLLALPRTLPERTANLVVGLWRQPVRVHLLPDMYDLGIARMQVGDLGGLTVIGLREPAIDGFQRVAKRLVDLILGTLILVAALPAMAVIAVAIRLDSPGPVLFRQRRVGENGRLFTMYKFRTMVHDAESRQGEVNVYTPDGKVVHKWPDDPRVTRLGRWLRRFSLDELPQLFNVLRGEMSLVGPRPELPWIVEQYEPWQYQRLAVPQGMTCWYVVNGRSEVPMHLNTQEDLRYIREFSLLTDLKILWKSVGAVLKRRGAF
ncbi:MAG: sugar transferase [Armatimonadota bacterium]|nr:sugar transferase [Armatimonadota bacterium]MDR7612976.1 sugar transferase [Armatimonadota bacterium]